MKKAKYITAKRKRQRGFTMIELMITVTLVAILASIAVPSMRTYVLNNRLNSTAQEFLRTLQTARSEATKRQRNVVVCASANPTAAASAITCNTSGTSGWVMFDDIDGNGASSSATELLEVHTFDSSKMSLLTNGSVSYAATGFANPGGASSVVVCDSRGNVDSNGGTTGTNSVARAIDIVGTGRTRITKTLAEITTKLSVIGSACPP